MRNLLLHLILAFALAATGYSGDTLTFSKSYGNFQNAVSISTGRGESVFIADAEMNTVFKFSAAGVELARFGGSGFGSYSLNNPVSIDGSNGIEVFISDNLNNRIQKLDYKLNVITAFDFTKYNQTADNSKRIYYPIGVASLSSGDIAVISSSSENKSFIISSFSDINIFLGSNFGFNRLGKPSKIVRGRQLDVWILDKETNEVVNFVSSGLYVKRLKLMTSEKILSIAYFDDHLYFLTQGSLYRYNLIALKYDKVYGFGIDQQVKINDFAILNTSDLLVLTSNNVYVFNLTN